MRTWVVLSVAAMTLLAFAAVASAGANSTATYRLAWGPTGANQSINANKHDISIADTTSDTTANLWVTVIGVSQITAYDLQLVLLADRSFGGQFALPSTWQFLGSNACFAGGLTDNLVVTRSGMGTNNLFLLSPNPPTSQQQMSFIDNLWYIWVSSAQAVGIARTAATRYTLARLDITIGGSATFPDCFGGGAPVCIQPNLTQGYNGEVYSNYKQVSVALVDNAPVPLTDFATADPGFGFITANYQSPANTGLSGCPAPTHIRTTTWGQLKRLYH